VKAHGSNVGGVKGLDEAPHPLAGTARSAWPLDTLAALVSLVGLADAIYLTVEHLAGRSVRCVVVSGCDEVLASSYATLPGGIPLAALGALAYFAAFSFATLSAFGHRIATSLLAALVSAMFAASLYLLFLQAFVLESFCTYCLLSAAVSTTLACIVAARWFFTFRAGQHTSR
jgi:uncharacterized membrane protein